MSKTTERFKQLFTPAMLDYLLVFGIYSILFFYSVLCIPEIVFPPSGTDPFSNWILAEVISQKGILLKGMPAYFFTPLYAYLGYFLRLFFSDVAFFFAVWIAFQIGIFLVSALYFRRLVRAVISPRCERIGFFLYVFYPPFIFHALLPVKDILIVSCAVMFFYHFLRAVELKKNKPLIFAGLFLGICINFRGNFAVLLVVCMIFLIRKSGITRGILLCVAAAAPVLPFTARNIFVAHDYVLTSSVGGIHIYMGFNEKARGTYTFLENIRPSTFGHFYDSKKIAEQATGTAMNGSEVNRFWKHKTAEYIRANPYSAVRLLGKKIALLFNRIEFANNFSFDYFKEEYFLFRFLNVPYDFGVLMITGVIGLLFVRFKYKWLFVSSFVAVSCSMLTIFIAGRYRLPLAFFLMVFSLAWINAFLAKTLKLTREIVVIGILTACISYQIPPQIRGFDSGAKQKHIYARRQKQKYLKLGSKNYMEHYYLEKQKYVAEFTDENILENHTVSSGLSSK
ncbi:MAG: glycosyltransferase family 39 protein [bacterium]|nr:glycosyltransferase family 39 protein [bacterium]